MYSRIPEGKRRLFTVYRCTKANAPSVAEYTLGCVIACCRRFAEGAVLYKKGENNKRLFRKPVEMGGKTIGVIGAGPVSNCIMKTAN